MKANTITLIIFIATFILCSTTKLQSLKNTVEGNFQKTARNVKLSETVLKADLQRNDGTWNPVTSELDLNKYVANSEGKLVWGGKNYAQTCRSCTLANAVLYCSCRNSAGRVLGTSLKLASRVTNSNGNFSVAN